MLLSTKEDKKWNQRLKIIQDFHLMTSGFTFFGREDEIRDLIRMI